MCKEFDFDNLGKPIDWEQDFADKRSEILGEIEGVRMLVESLYNAKYPHKYEPKNQDEIDWAIADVSMAIGSLVSLMKRESRAWERHHQERLGILSERESDPDIPFS